MADHYANWTDGRHYHAICGRKIVKEGAADIEGKRTIFAHSKERCRTCVKRIKGHGYSLDALKMRYKRPFNPYTQILRGDEGI